MRHFTDYLGRRWNIEINPRTIKLVKVATVDLIDLANFYIGDLPILENEKNLRVILAGLCDDQRHGSIIDHDDFDGALDGVLDEAHEAIIGALADYWPGEKAAALSRYWKFAKRLPPDAVARIAGQYGMN
jgi:hypothetical protein